MSVSKTSATLQSGCAAKLVVLAILFIFLWCNGAFGQSKTTPQDSVALVQKQLNQYLDSLVLKTSMNDLREYLWGRITVKQYNEAKFVELWNFFLQDKADEWVSKRQKKN